MTLSLTHRHAEMRLREPFRISGYLFEAMPAVTVELRDTRLTGRGEAAGVYFLGEDVGRVAAELERCRADIEAGIDREALRTLLPAGGARNAVDCALWELESLRAGKPVWTLAEAPAPRPLVTTFTIPAVDAGEVAQRLAPLGAARSLKLKFEGDLDADAERLRAVRRVRPDVWLAVDANQGFRPADFDRLAAILVEGRVALLEQPVRRGAEADLDGWRSPVPLAADESILDLAELHEREHRFDIINIKLDKCGGLTEALLMVAEATRRGKRSMVGNMAGSALAAAPGFVLGQFCHVVDLDGPYFLADEGDAPTLYTDGFIDVPSGFWGAASAPTATGVSR